MSEAIEKPTTDAVDLDRPVRCECSMATSMLGDGCRFCNPELGAELKWNSEADEYNQWDDLGQDEKDELIAEFISANAKGQPRPSQSAEQLKGINMSDDTEKLRDGEASAAPSCSGLCAHDKTETLPDIARAFIDRDWIRFALLVSGAPEIEKPGNAHWAMREIAIAAIARLKYEEQQNHLEAITDYAINAERDCR